MDKWNNTLNSRACIFGLKHDKLAISVQDTFCCELESQPIRQWSSYPIYSLKKLYGVQFWKALALSAFGCLGFFCFVNGVFFQEHSMALTRHHIKKELLENQLISASSLESSLFISSKFNKEKTAQTTEFLGVINLSVRNLRGGVMEFLSGIRGGLEEALWSF